MQMEICADPISNRELLAYQADLKGSIFRQIRRIFHRMKQHGVTQKTLARRIGMDEGQLSRRLRGDYDLRLETLSDLARGLECRMDVKLTPLADVGRPEFVMDVPGGESHVIELIDDLEDLLKEIRGMVEKNKIVAAVEDDGHKQ